MKPPQRKSSQAAHHRHFMNKKKKLIGAHYSHALKETTSKYSQGNISYDKVCTKYNSLYELPLSPCLTKSTLRNYIKIENIN